MSIDELHALAHEAITAAKNSSGPATRELVALLARFLSHREGDPRDERWDALCEAAIDEDELLGDALNFVVCAAAHELNGGTNEPTYRGHLRGARQSLDELSARRRA